MIERLAKSKAILISYKLWMGCNMEDFFSLTEYYFTGTDRNNTRIGMLSNTDTNYFSLSKYVMEVVDNFSLEENIVGITSGGGRNIQVCREALESKYRNDSVFPLPKPLVTMDCLGHILAGYCKAGVQSIKSGGGEVDTELKKRNMQKCITWTKNIWKGDQALL